MTLQNQQTHKYYILNVVQTQQSRLTRYYLEETAYQAVKNIMHVVEAIKCTKLHSRKRGFVKGTIANSTNRVFVLPQFHYSHQ